MMESLFGFANDNQLGSALPPTLEEGTEEDQNAAPPGRCICIC